MDYSIKTINGVQLILCEAVGLTVEPERLALDLISACYEYDTHLILFCAGSLPDEFFRLRTGMAGAVLQKLTNYSVKAALVLDRNLQGKFDDFRAETNRGGTFRIFDSEAEAERWLLES